MRCTSPRKVGFKTDGKTISWSPKTSSNEYPEWQMPCGKCIECRLEYARNWAIRSIHEAQMHENNSFITLTYSEENLADGRLNYIDFQLFAKRLRDKIFQKFLKSYGRENWQLLSKEEKKDAFKPYKIGIFVTGEYGDKTKRPHWHALIFNWRPDDLKKHYATDKGDQVYTSDLLTETWGKGHAEIGQVTFESAGYVARYAAKKLGHGKDEDHDFQPISKKSSHQAIGKSWLEKYYKDVFTHGYIEHEGVKLPIPKYYERWFQKTHPEEWVKYVTETKRDKIRIVSAMAELETKKYTEQLQKRGPFKGTLVSRNEARRKITKAKFKQLQENLKL